MMMSVQNAHAKAVSSLFCIIYTFFYFFLLLLFCFFISFVSFFSYIIYIGNAANAVIVASSLLCCTIIYDNIAATAGAVAGAIFVLVKHSLNISINHQAWQLNA